MAASALVKQAGVDPEIYTAAPTKNKSLEIPYK
jgi:hypothetical protein